jgi:serine/tyrosine/threonine adenylyltransferase
VVATGDRVIRETVLPGAILTRVAASHIRVGTFQYARATGDLDLLRRLTDHAIARHHPDAATPLEFYEAVLETQAGLVAQWMHVGFIHGVMNTDNMAVSGESIDFGPCAFMDFYEPATVFSSIDHGGRYAYGNQPSIAQWNLARFAEALLPLLADDVEAAAAKATEALQTFPDRFLGHWQRGMLAKLGLGSADEDEELVNDLLKTMHVQGDDYTGTFRTLARVARGEEEPKPAYAEWVARWRALAPDAAAMDRVNPVYIPRNHLVEDALTQATVGDLAPLHRLLDAITDPFAERPGLEAYAQPGPDEFGDRYVTFCGT